MTGRKCDGYQFPASDETNTSLVARPPPPKSDLPTTPGDTSSATPLRFSINPAFQGSFEERRTFERFQARTIPAISGVSEGEFWEKLVLRVGQQESIVRNAIIALGALHEDYQLSGGSYENFQKASNLYGKALSELGARLSQKRPENAKLAIISSILFACFEVLRRNGMAAISHFNAGMKALLQHMPPKDTSINASSMGTISTAEATRTAGSKAIQPFFRTVPQDDVDVMLRVFSRYDIQACTFAKPKAERLTVTLPDTPPTSLTLPEIKNYLDSLLVAVYQHTRSDLVMHRYFPLHTVPPILIHRRDQALITFEQWLSAIEKFFSENVLALTTLEAKALLGLRLQVRTAILELRTCISCPAETSFDAFHSDFLHIVTRCERLADSLGLPECEPLATDPSGAGFTMELGICHPLFFVATKCRDYSLRRRAIACLKRAGREGVWEGPVMAIVAERIVQLEEEGVSAGDKGNAACVPEGNRFHYIRKDVDYDARRVFIEAGRCRNGEETAWRNWEKVREAVPF